MNLTNYLENKLADHVLRNVAYVSPTNVYVALHTANPTEAGNVAEISQAGYSRKLLTVGAPVDGISKSTTDLSWDISADVTITHITIWDAATAGNPLFYGPLSAEKSLEATDIFRVPADSLTAGFE